MLMFLKDQTEEKIKNNLHFHHTAPQRILFTELFSSLSYDLGRIAVFHITKNKLCQKFLIVSAELEYRIRC